MSMSPRLLRPRQTLHPEASSWASRVVANGGTVSGTTLSAVDKFCDSIASAGIRDRFYRLNLFCGSNLNACLTPLYRAASLGDTQLGNATDTNVGGLFVSGDYNETGAIGGLKAGSGKRLNTGLNQTDIGVDSCHLAIYEPAKATGSFNNRIGSRTSALTNEHVLTGGSAAESMAYGIDNLAGNRRAQTTTAYTEGGAFFIGSNLSSTAATLYKNGASIATASPVARTAQSLAYFVFALNESGAAGDPMTTGRIAAYSVGLGMTGPEAAAYNTAMQAFQTSLTRNV
jgi:hypothetical protein